MKLKFIIDRKLSRSSIKLFENSSVRGTKAIELNDSVAFSLIIPNLHSRQSHSNQLWYETHPQENPNTA